jgi:hypothetical protein
MYPERRIPTASCVAALATAAVAFGGIQLTPSARAGWEYYVRTAEAGMDAESASHGLQALDRLPAERAKVLAGEIVAVPFAHRAVGDDPGVPIRDGLINHWLGAMFIPHATPAEVRSVLEDYPDYKTIYGPDISASTLLARSGDRFDVALRMSRQVRVKLLFNYTFPVEFNATFHVRYFESGDVLEVRSRSTRIAEVKDPQKSHTIEYPAGNDDGYLWRLNTYWRIYQGRDGETPGTFAECEVISLSRAVPGFVQKTVSYFTTNFPEQSMRDTLEATRRALMARKSGGETGHG